MTDAIKGHTVAEAETRFDAFHLMVTTPISDPIDESQIGKLAVFSGVRESRLAHAESPLSGSQVAKTE